MCRSTVPAPPLPTCRGAIGEGGTGTVVGGIPPFDAFEHSSRRGHKVQRNNDGLQPTKVIAALMRLSPPDLVPLRCARGKRLNYSLTAR